MTAQTDDVDRCGQCGRMLEDGECPDLRCAWWTDGTDPDGDDGVDRVRTSYADTYDDGADGLRVESVIRQDLASVQVDVFGTVRLPDGDVIGAAIVAGDRVAAVRIGGPTSTFRVVHWFDSAPEAATWMDGQRSAAGYTGGEGA